VSELCADKVAAGGCGAVDGLEGEEKRFLDEYYFGMDMRLKTGTSDWPDLVIYSGDYLEGGMEASLTQRVTYY
jgi:hypothetical protein